MSDTHGKPTEGMECMCTLEDITEESYCEYQTMPSGKWHPAMYSAGIVRSPSANTYFSTFCVAAGLWTQGRRRQGVIHRAGSSWKVYSVDDLQPCLAK
jgi:hypothetical protein